MNSTLGRPIRIMRIIARMNVGGPAVQVSNLMRGFNPTDFDQRLYTGYCEIDEADYLNSLATDIEVTRIKGFGKSIRLIGDLHAFVSLVRCMRDFKPDIIHTHTAKAGFLGRFASILFFPSAILVHTFHGHLLTGYFGQIKKTLVIIAERVLARFTTQLLAVGKKVREDLLQVGIGDPSTFGLMPPGLELQDLPDKNKAIETLKLSQSVFQCAYIGRVTSIKRPDRFLDVVAEIKRRDLEIEFFIAGDGELLDYCRNRVGSENLPVNLLGWQMDIENLLAAADLVVLTSDNAGTPLSLIQAGMAGLPVVSTNVGSISEVVLGDITGILTTMDVLEIADAIEKLFRNKELRAQMGICAQKFTLANFGKMRLVIDHEVLYKKLLSESIS